MTKRIWNQCLKEWAQFRRDRLTVALAFLLPLAVLLIYGYAIRLETNNIPLAVQDFDRSPLSRAYIERIFATNKFQPTAWAGNDPLENAIDPGVAKAAVIIPPDFSRQVQADQPSPVQVLVDGSDVNNARVIENSIRATTQFFLSSSGLQPGSPRVATQTRLWFNPGLKEALYIVPGTYAVTLWIFPSMLSALAMVREKERNTIVQVYASDLSAAEFLLGKGLAYLAIAIGQALVVMGMGTVLFGVWFAGDPTPLLVGTPIFLANSILFGLFVGSRAGNISGAIQGVAILGFLTALLLSGFIYPLSNIPFPLSVLTYVIPTRYYIEITRDAFVRGAGWAGVWLFLLALIALGFLLFNASRRVLSRMQLPD
jgi:ABC-2 type transport system permease protein